MVRMAPRELDQVKAELARRIESLVGELLPHGKRVGAEWVCGGFSGERGRNLSVHIGREKAGVWRDFRTADLGGGPLDLIAHARFGGQFRPALEWALVWLGWDTSRPLPAATGASQGLRVERDRRHQAERRRQAALGIWLQARESVPRDPVRAYLSGPKPFGRAIDVARLPAWPRSLRYHPALRHRESGQDLPAMVATITGRVTKPDGSPGLGCIGVHRTFLSELADPETGELSWAKAPVEPVKSILGPYTDGGGAVRLSRGAGGYPLQDPRSGDTVIISEGIETGLSIVLACPGDLVICACTLSGMRNVWLPDHIRRVVLAAENGNHPSAEQAFGQVVKRFLDQGREVEIMRPPKMAGDFNDLL